MTKIISGFMYFFMTALYLLSGVMHLWTVYIAFKIEGIFWALITLVFPVISQVYWGIVTYNESGLDTLYIQLMLVTIVLWIINFIVMGIIEKNDPTDFRHNHDNRNSTQTNVEEVSVSIDNELERSSDKVILNGEELSRDEYIKRQFDVNYEEDFANHEASVAGVELRKSNNPVKGWLVVLLILLIIKVLQSVIYFVDIIPNVTSTDFSYMIADRHDLAIATLLELLFNSAYLFLVILSIYYMFTAKKRFISSIIMLYSLTLIGNIIFYFVYVGLPETSDYLGITIRSILISIIHASIWIPYVLSSKRVKNTYVK